MTASTRRSLSRTAWYAALALGAFVAAFVILSLMLGNAETLVRLGLVSHYYYVVLLLLGLAVAAFLFGAMKSYATYNGLTISGHVALGGPATGFFIAVVLGLAFVHNPLAFSVTVFVHGEGGKQELVVRNKGAVLLDLGGDRRREAVGDKGEAHFPGIPPTFRGQTVGVSFEHDDYELLPASNATIKLNADGIYLAVRPKSFRISGYVKSMNGEPVSGATVALRGRRTTTDESGFFVFVLSAKTVKESASLHVTAEGYAPWHGQVTPGGNEITVPLEKVN